MKHLRCVLAAAVACLALALPSSAAADTDPVLFVHGFGDQASAWNTFKNWFVADGWDPSELYASSYNNYQSNEATAEEIMHEAQALIDQTGAEKVDVVTHSMGGLSGRLYIKNYGGDLWVDDFVSISGPNHGTASSLACALFVPPCFEMVPGSSFLQSLNATDETPGDVNYGTWRTWCDLIIVPSTSTKLDGASNYSAGCKTHAGMRTDRSVYEGVRNFID